MSFFEALRQDLEIVENICVFTLRVTTWMMMMQRLSPSGTLDTAVSELLNGNGREIPEPCRKVNEGNIYTYIGLTSPVTAPSCVLVLSGRCSFPVSQSPIFRKTLKAR